ncbi:MAG: response regulator transcription factor [Pseudomonadota bacterium]
MNGDDVAGPIRIVLTDDHRMVLDGLKSCLEAYDDLDIVAAVTSAAEALDAIAEHSPDVVLLDINMPNMTGLEAAARITSEHPRTRVLMVSMHDTAEYISSALANGASGYVLKDVPAREIATAIVAVHSGGTYLSSGASDRLVARPCADDAAVNLSSREQDVLVLLAEGKSNKEVAQLLTISVRTVETHRKNLKRKLAISTTAGLTRYVIQHGLTRATGA